MLDNADEQAAQVRRELDGRLQLVEQMSRQRKHPKFVVKEMESMYVDELKAAINLLMANLESLPVSKGRDSNVLAILQLSKWYPQKDMSRWINCM
ncbi:calcium-dependent secretion activator, partial [Mytilus galloprovincialis]